MSLGEGSTREHKARNTNGPLSQDASAITCHEYRRASWTSRRPPRALAWVRWSVVGLVWLSSKRQPVIIFSFFYCVRGEGGH